MVAYWICKISHLPKSWKRDFLYFINNCAKLRVGNSKEWSINTFMPKLRSDILFVRVHLSFVLQNQLGWFMVWLLMWKRTGRHTLSQSSLENRLDSFWFWLRVFCCSKPINGGKKELQFPLCKSFWFAPFTFKIPKTARRSRKKKKADRSVLHFENFSVEMWLKFETAQRLHFQIPYLFWATSFYLYNFRIRMPLAN